MEEFAARDFLFEVSDSFCLNSSRMNTIPVDPEKYAHLVKCAAAIEFLESRGVCWRGAEKIETDWVIGEETEWAYTNREESLVDRILRHRSGFSRSK